ncbi:hypothetical protein M409DRAFT_57139 [Zasmidium cellare ATCC 36951]|uniref:Phosphoribosyltransferase domain-containing protein n=1 Tax=Zasmidium cellare ATCC 36951 TaxID=1080233 RepID=A0A6A6CEG7_ZASCE|nr:uncharacterized protein M409DRAFT_57139 [Zasmidium cellare ATCC 36951]KAF2164049.1 hypothetical protein M409DRAFT_57139 [Zasmidium cellare ATCC 36951]
MCLATSPLERPPVVGIYGVSGSGKSHLLAQLKHELKDDRFLFWEGSEEIDAVVPGGLEAFKALHHNEQARFRAAATDRIREQCTESGCVGVVAGHFMFWNEQEEQGQAVWTESDQNTFTHIVYLDIPPSQIDDMRRQDERRARESMSVRHLDLWKRTEEKSLRALCGTHGILFSRVFPYPALLPKVAALIRDFQRHTVERNLKRAEVAVDVLVQGAKAQLESMLVIDGDKTLAPEDTGELFWHRICTDRLSWDLQWSPSAVFKSPLGYSYAAFRQVSLLYEEAVDEEEFEDVCAYVAEQVNPYLDFVSLLKRTVDHAHVGAVIVTCGIGRIWEKVLGIQGLSHDIKVLGAGRISTDFVVTPAVKAAIVGRLRDTYGLHVSAFGDSPLDLPMLKMANKAFVVVGTEEERSKSMEQKLKTAIDEDGLRACQILLPATAVRRLDYSRLPPVSLADWRLIETIFRRRASLTVLHATTKNAARLLMAPMRDARLSGPDLRERHRQSGWYLAVEYISAILGVEEYGMPHVQGHSSTGHRLSQEEQTMIVALMRGGEPMALGVNAAFPLASFVHAKAPNDLKPEHFEGRKAVVIVDSVINTGKSVKGFVDYIHNCGYNVRIIVVAGVVQAEAVSEGSLLSKLSQEGEIKFVALRISDNKFKGSGSTDTGNRLFNNTYIS